MENKIETMPIENLGFNGYIRGILLRAGINTVGDILSKSDFQIIQITGMGRKSFDTVMKKIEELRMKEAGVEGLQEVQLGIEKLQLSGRTSNCLRRAGISKISQLEEVSVEEMLKIDGIGEKTIEEIQRALKDYHKEKEGEEPKTQLQELKEQKLDMVDENRRVIDQTSELKGKLETYRTYKDGIEEAKEELGEKE